MGGDGPIGGSARGAERQSLGRGGSVNHFQDLVVGDEVVDGLGGVDPDLSVKAGVLACNE